MEWTTERPFQALCISGGGYKGLFSARALQVLEDHIQAPIGSRFDLIAGTSIGGIIALAAAFEIPMTRVVETFERHGSRIFPNRKWDFVRRLRRARYSANTLREAVAEILPPNLLLRDARRPVVIPSVNVTQGRPQVFKTRHRSEWIRDSNYKVVDVALATSAAPTYFEMAKLDGCLYADGGLFANSPELVAVHEAETFLGVRSQNIRILSIGTTTQSYSSSHSESRDCGIWQWMREGRLFNVGISAQHQFVDQIMKHRFGKSYFRIDHELSGNQLRDVGLDVASDAARATLVGLGKKAATDVAATQLAEFLGHEPQLANIRD